MISHFFMTGEPEFIDTDYSNIPVAVKAFGETTLDASALELKFDYGLDKLWRINTSGGSIRYEFRHGFIDRLMEYLWTQDMKFMTHSEQMATSTFVEFEDTFSSSALVSDANYLAIGATNELAGKSFVVKQGPIVTNIPAQGPFGTIVNAEVWEALDKTIMSIFNGTYVPVHF